MDLFREVYKLAGALGAAAGPLTAVLPSRQPSLSRPALDLESLAVLFHISSILQPIFYAFKLVVKANALEPSAIGITEFTTLLTMSNFCEALCTGVESYIKHFNAGVDTFQAPREEIVELLVKSISSVATGFAFFCQVIHKMTLRYLNVLVASKEHCMGLPVLHKLINVLNNVLSASLEGKLPSWRQFPNWKELCLVLILLTSILT